ncbi:alpha/beta-type small acid-soluble spore protein [Fervidibacillus halotolerans]|uniref:Alpha/beta-type small acid-soluble spore protein n=1 Tax=Fervidibacillus halotolerans TaxID=2980027 RepID=A0A9E8M112_9BACI|nr:alpha/beta-type small acid-soluble spore protein [Fervidibacillus halotolerans]WAA13206.1 alpha/beta-type small acid-soluble spore protein [Fervidibacillus halotolerans]
MAKRANSLIVPGVEKFLNEYKYEIAQEFGVHLNGNTKSRENGSVGGEMTKRLIRQAQSQLSNKN